MKKTQIARGLATLSVIVLLSGCSHVTEEMKTEKEEGIALLDAGDYESAIAAFDGLIDQTDRVTSFEIDVLKYRGEAEYRLGDYEAAAYTYDLLERVDKDQAEYHYLASMSYSKDGKTDQAKEELDSGISSDLNHKKTGYVQAMKNLATAYVTEGKEEEAETLYQELEEEGFSDTELVNSQVLMKMQEENYQDALTLCESGLALPDDLAKKELSFNRAVCYEYLGEYETAIEAFQAYEETYGANEEAEHEIAFLKTR